MHVKGVNPRVFFLDYHTKHYFHDASLFPFHDLVIDIFYLFVIFMTFLLFYFYMMQ